MLSYSLYRDTNTAKHKTDKGVVDIKVIIDRTTTSSIGKLYQVHAVLCDHTQEAFRMSLMRDAGVLPSPP